MPPKRRAIGRSTPQARKRRALRASESDEQRASRLENLRVHAAETRSSESSEQREVRLETDRIRTNQTRSSETTELRERRLQALVPPATTLAAFYSLCQDDLFAKTLLYSEVPKFYTWNASTKKFQRRKQGKAVEGHPNLYSSDALGRLYTVHPNNTECFYLRLLLINIRGPISFQDLRTVNGQLCATYRQACQELNLLENDAHWDTALADASNTARPQQIRTLFSIILTTCFPSNPKDLWEKYKDYNSCFQMTSFGATNIVRENYMPTFRVQGQIYHRAGSLLPLPIIPRSTPADELNACLKSSVLWRHLQKLTLKTNMRVQLQRDASAGNFAKQLLDIGNGRMEIDESTQCITLPANFCKITESIDELVQKVFPNIAQNYKNHQWLSTRAILAAKNIDVNTINFTIQHGIPSETTTYKSIDTVENQDEVVNYPTEFLNSLDLPGMPPHVLTLKIGVPIILLRNINPPRLCNGTRLSVKKMMNNVIEATILTGKFKGEDVLLPRIPMIPTDMPFEFKRLQFPVRLAFAMTINKAQGQSLQVCGLNLENPCFSHGQLYVACSRVGKPSDLFVYAPDGKTRNIVYPTALQ